MAFLEIRGVSKSFNHNGRSRSRGVSPVLHDINLAIDGREFACIVGRSGSGKTTLISLIAGLLEPDRGEILLEGEPIQGPGPERGIVFQNYSLLPWLTVFENVYLAVDAVAPGLAESEKRERTRHYVNLVNLRDAAGKRPRELSGGMRQRVAVARGLAMDPKVLLLDEPFSALDALTRAMLQEELARIWMESKKSVVMITNDIDEAILLADSIYPLTSGPGATLGPALRVSSPHPRSRRQASREPAYQRLRREMLGMLVGGQKGRRATPASAEIPYDHVRRREREKEMTTFLELTQLGKSYAAGNGQTVIVKNFNLRVRQGEFVCIVGHSGCGKSTVLSIVMGLNEATEGGVILAGKEVGGPGLDRGVVFQSPALLPWLTARENVLLALEQVNGHCRRKEKRELAEKYLARVGLKDVADGYPDELSAGMRQRAGIARAFGLEPKVLLLDEPFSLLDVITRMELQDELMRLWEEERKTVLMVTHDVDEAILLADRIVLMTNGPAATVGEIVEVPFLRPRQRFQILADPEYDRVRSYLIAFLEERADRGRSVDLPAEAVPAPYKLAGGDGRANHVFSDEERFMVEKYTGLNRFRARYRREEPLVAFSAGRGGAGVEGT